MSPGARLFTASERFCSASVNAMGGIVAPERAVSGSDAALIQAEVKKLKRQLTLLPLFGLLYFTVSGGSFGIEGLIGGSGPGLALLLIAITPLVFSLPNVLMVRELNSMMPVEGGYYHWVKQAFGPFAGFMAGWNNWVVTWLDVAIYPVLAAYYLGWFMPALRNGTTALGVEWSADTLQWGVSAVIIVLISLLQIRGARLSGLFTDVLGIAIMIPLALLTVLGFVAWARSGQTVPMPFLPEGQSLTTALSTGLFIVMWNYMGWELPAVAGDEIQAPKKTYARAMALVLVASIATYALPVVACLQGGAGEDGRWQLWGLEASSEEVGIVADIAGEDADAAELREANTQLESWNVEPNSSIGWEFPEIGEAVGKKLGSAALAQWMGGLLSVAAMLSMVGLFVGNSLGGSRIPFALAEDGMFPRQMVRVHPKYGTPWVAIVFVGVIFIIFSWQTFAVLVVADVFLQCLVILAEFAATWRLRFTLPDVARDRVPGGWFGMTLATLGPTAIIVLAIVSQVRDEGMQALWIPLVGMAIGAVLYVPLRRKLKPGVPDVNPFRPDSE
jgi:amino acid transporter